MTPHATRRLFAVGALAVAGAALYIVSMSTMGEDLVYYLSPTELVAKGKAAEGATVRLGGMVEQGSVDWNPDEQTLAFRVTDGTETIAVTGVGAPPQMFREGIGVVVEGELHADSVFHTDTVMVKHSNEYKAPEEGERPEDIYKNLENTLEGT
jgi:cytochrome c-type biogenesis protein CcmE